MKIILKANDIDEILRGVARIGDEGRGMIGMYSSADLNEVIRRLEFIRNANKNIGIYSPNGPCVTWKDITKDIELTYEEYTVVVAILRMTRNAYEKKELWEGF
ncbi:hypothetical protein CPTMiller_0023 [Citrobacter phage Miller]|uniref:Uncharacterized protein n=1 Tax=Citrobacter phage Miller TaxID=1527524 RepID=A0A076YMG4_9CAUD|nr:hypothetical protein CPTMiller_0023 [Citrobacter phage Miller]AIK67959.1 hypothetical protein CPTMiller_0023 [Citrobacter phage Miller]